jgi:hypothetical protein
MEQNLTRAYQQVTDLTVGVAELGCVSFCRNSLPWVRRNKTNGVASTAAIRLATVAQAC